MALWFLILVPMVVAAEIRLGPLAAGFAIVLALFWAYVHSHW